MARGAEFYLALAAVAAASAAVALAVVEPLAPKAQTTARVPFSIRGTNADGRIRVDWDPRSTPVRMAERATLEAEDAGRIERYPVDKSTLNQGGLDYVRKSEDVLLTLTLHHEGQPDLAASIRTIGPIEQPRVEPVAAVTRPERKRSRGSQTRGRRR